MKNMSEKIEFENITIRAPKKILDFLRAHEKDMGRTAEEYIEFNLVQGVRADLDAGDVFTPTGPEIAKYWDLNVIFKQMINDPYE